MLLAGAFAALPGCGSAPPHSVLSHRDSAALHGLIAQIRSEARADRPEEAKAAIASFEREVEAFAATGSLTTDDATAMLVAARHASERLRAEASAQAQPSGPAPTPEANPEGAPAPAPAQPSPSQGAEEGPGKSESPGKSEDHGKSHGKSKEHGKGKGD